MKFTVKLIWDDEAKVWYTNSNDISGLCLEAETFDELVEEVRLAAPELLEFNCQYEGPIYLIFEAIRSEMAKVS
jgi:predicted RNase H-like HicB family nuclease